MEQKIAIYPGTFDPVHNGHLDVIKDASQIFSKVIWAIGVNSTKEPMFSVEQRLEMMDLANKFQNVEVVKFSGLLVNFAESVGAEFIIRSLRTIVDFEYEFQMSLINKQINPRISTIYLPASQSNLHISSTLVRELILSSELIDNYVPSKVMEYISGARRGENGN